MNDSNSNRRLTFLGIARAVGCFPLWLIFQALDALRTVGRWALHPLFYRQERRVIRLATYCPTCYMLPVTCRSYVTRWHRGPARGYGRCTRCGSIIRWGV